MIRDFYLGVLSSGVVFSFTFMISYRSLLVSNPLPPPCKSTCQITLTQERFEIEQQQIVDIGGAGDDDGKSAAEKYHPVKTSAVLLLWTPLRDSHDNWQEHFGPPSDPYLEFCEENCPLCEIAVHSDRSRLETSDIVVFNLQDLNLGDFSDKEEWIKENLPGGQRLYSQKWALFWRESPGQLKIPDEKLAWMDNVFNWTVSYRRDSDIFYPFGYFKEIPKKVELNMPWRKLWRRKNAVWFSNNCNSTAQGEVFAQEISQFRSKSFRLKPYGPCDPDGDMPRNFDGRISVMEAVYKKTRFYFAFEEEICDDFITEDFFKALELSYVPVVLGGQDIGYDEVALAGTYIDAMDYREPKQVAKMLGDLTRSSSEFGQYLAWQHDYEVLPSLNWVCSLKSKIFSPDEELKRETVVSNFKTFWQQKKCYGSYKEAVFNAYDV